MALRNQPYIPLYVQDYLTDEKLNECSASAQGIYIKLMCLMHKSTEYGCILLKQKDKQSDKQMYNFACKLVKHLPFTFEEILEALAELISEEVLYLDGDKISQKRMVKDNELSLKRADAGKKGGESTQFAKAKPKPKTQASSENEIETEDETITDNEDDNVTVLVWPTFEDFWVLYDKKVGDKVKIEKKWNKISQKEREKIMVYIADYVGAQPNKQYRKNPETFINNKSWNDEIIKSNNNGKISEDRATRLKIAFDEIDRDGQERSDTGS